MKVRYTYYHIAGSGQSYGLAELPEAVLSEMGLTAAHMDAALEAYFSGRR